MITCFYTLVHVPVIITRQCQRSNEINPNLMPNFRSHWNWMELCRGLASLPICSLKCITSSYMLFNVVDHVMPVETRACLLQCFIPAKMASTWSWNIICANVFTYRMTDYQVYRRGKFCHSFLVFFVEHPTSAIFSLVYN